MRIWSPSKAGKTAVFELRKLRPDLSGKNLVQNRNQGLRCLIVSGVDVRSPNCVCSSVPGRSKASHRVLVKDVQDIKVKAKPIAPVVTKPVIVRPRQVRLREGRSSSHIAPFD